MSVHKRLVAVTILIVLVPLALSACGGSGTGSTSVSAGLPILTLDYFAGAGGALAKTLDPAQVTDSTAADTIALVNANLVHILPNNRVAPDLATWTVDSSRTVYTFTMRPNARFANGHRVTAEDAAWSITRALAPATASPVAESYLGLIRGASAYSTGKAQSVSGLKVLGKRTLQITITQPAAYFLMTLSYPTADVLDPAVVRHKPAGATGNFLTQTCSGNQGAGPFRFVCQNTSSGQTSFYSAGQTPQYALKPNPYYYGAKPKVQLQLPAISLIDTNYREYLAGNVDTSFVPTPFLSKWINKSSEYLGYPTSIVTYLTPNTKSPPFSDVHCRLAVAYGIDRQTIVNRILHGSVRADYVVLPYGYLGYYNGSKSEPHYDPQIARRELSRCAYRLQPVSLTFPNTSSDATNTYTAIASMLNQIGFNVTPKAVTANDWVSVVSEPLSKSNTQIVRNGWQQDYPDPQDYAGLLLHTGAQNNIGGWSNASYDRLVDRAALESNRSQRAALYRQAQHIALSQGAWISLFNTVGHQLVKPYVHGLVGTSAYGDLVPRNYDWSQVSISKH